MIFETSTAAILQKIDQIDPVAYGKSRNYVDGAVSHLSPYISRGVLSTKLVFERLQVRGIPFSSMEKFVQELAWRDYWQQLWIAKGTQINTDLKSEQLEVLHRAIPEAIVKGTTGIQLIDQGIQILKDTGHLHNHMRMYLASIACNIAKSHWKHPAEWMYYHLLDGDWASNALSWQWVAGTNSNKKYFANQDNINTFFYGSQKGSFLDVPYEAFENIPCPENLSASIVVDFKTPLPASDEVSLLPERPVLLYNYYNLDPFWREDEAANRILLLEPSVFEKHPVSEKCIDFVIKLSKNIPGIQVFVGEFEDLAKQALTQQLIFKEHPLNKHYKGTQDERDWLSSVKGDFSSFFRFWKPCKKELKNR